MRWNIPEAPTTSVKHYGWVDDPIEVEDWLSREPKPMMADAAPALMGTEHRDVCLWEQGEIPIFGRPLPAHAQTVGDCVSHGTTRVIQDALYIAWAFGQATEVQHEFWTNALDSEEESRPPQLATEPNYAFSRIEVGGGRLRGDGSIGAWGAEAAVKYGMLARIKYPTVDLSEYSGSLARRWGGDRNGVPEDLEPIARTHLVGSAKATFSGEEAKAALYNLYGLAACSNQGFTTVRDSRGMCKPSGSWAHCMAIRGILNLKGNLLVVVFQQSWGNSPTGNDKVELESGRTVTLPQGGFCVDFEAFEKRVLRSRDTFAFTGPAGFEPREPKDLDWWTPA